MADINTVVTGLLIALFSTKGAALAIAFLILVMAFAILISVYAARIRPLVSALYLSVREFPSVVNLADLAEVDALMIRPGKARWRLRHAWSAYRAGFVLSPDGHLRSGAPAWEVFAQVSPETQVLGWWANLFVGIGLIMTFLGVVAALSEATSVLGTSSDPNVMQTALSGLLTITATKFWTSIAGVAASIIMRIYERRWTVRIERLVDDLCIRIDQRIPPVTQGMLAGEQLAEIQAQTKLLAEVRDSLAALAAQGRGGRLAGDIHALQTPAANS
jgi:hypothetical protein